MERPLFFLAVESEDCLFTLSCNGVFVYDNKDGTPDRVTIPVSWSMINGLNEVSLECAPSENATGEDTNFCTVSVLVRSAEASSEANRSAMTICYKHHEDKSRLYLESSIPGKFNHSSLLPDDDGQILVGPVTPRLDTQMAGIKCSRNITLPYKIPTWKWQKSDIIENDENLIPALNKEIEKVWNMYKAKDVDGLLSLIEERMVEMAAALHKDLDQLRAENRESILETLNDEDLKLFPLYPDHNLLRLHENKKLVELRTWQDKHVIAFNLSFGGSVNMNYIFRKEKGKWIVCR